MQIGFNGRFFPQNWRPALTEIEFAADGGFSTIQVRGSEMGLTADNLGADFATVKAALSHHEITPVMEIMIPLDEDGRSPQGHPPLAVLHHNLPAIIGLGCRCVHWHLLQSGDKSKNRTTDQETALVDQLTTAVQLGQQHDFQFGIEHNAPSNDPFFATPAQVQTILRRVAGLRFVWDWSHAQPPQNEAYGQMAGHASMLHISDTPLPALNHHLPLGEGMVDFDALCQALIAARFSGPAILEIGGTPASGGYGKDTDAALLNSKRRLEDAYQLAREAA